MVLVVCLRVHDHSSIYRILGVPDKYGCTPIISLDIKCVSSYTRSSMNYHCILISRRYEEAGPFHCLYMQILGAKYANEYSYGSIREPHNDTGFIIIVCKSCDDHSAFN